jgi:hypothetical protein
MNGQMFRPLEMHKQVIPARLPLVSKPANQTRLFSCRLDPIDPVELQLRLCIFSHTGAGGRRGVDITFTALSAYLFWTSMRSDVSDFVKSCIHCLETTGGSRVPRPPGEALHDDRLNLFYTLIFSISASRVLDPFTFWFFVVICHVMYGYGHASMLMLPIQLTRHICLLLLECQLLGFRIKALIFRSL